MTAQLGGVQLGGVATNSSRTPAEIVFDPGQSLRGLHGLLSKGKKMSSTPVGDAYAALTRDQWYTYVNTFIPIENKLIQYATDPTAASHAMEQASTNTTAAMDVAQAGAARRLQGLGVSLDADEKVASDRSFGLAKSLADVGAQNTARDNTRQRQQSILGNPAPAAIQI